MNSTDMARLNLSENAVVDVFNETGELRGLLLVSYPIKPGNVMTYFPEANSLIPQAIDQRSRTPAFKSVAIELRTAT